MTAKPSLSGHTSGPNDWAASQSRASQARQRVRHRPACQPPSPWTAVPEWAVSRAHNCLPHIFRQSSKYHGHSHAGKATDSAPEQLAAWSTAQCLVQAVCCWLACVSGPVLPTMTALTMAQDALRMCYTKIVCKENFQMNHCSTKLGTSEQFKQGDDDFCPVLLSGEVKHCSENYSDVLDISGKF